MVVADDCDQFPAICAQRPGLPVSSWARWWRSRTSARPGIPIACCSLPHRIAVRVPGSRGGVTGPGITTKPARRPTVVVQMSRYAMSQDGRLSHCGSQLSHATRSPRRAAAITWLCCRREARRPRTRDPGAHPVASDPAGLYVGVRLLVALAVLGARLRWSRR